MRKEISRLWLLGLLAACFFAGCNNPEALLQRGNMAYRSGDLNAAAQFYKQAQQSPETEVTASFNLGKVLYEQGKPAEALVALEQALPLEVTYPLVRVYRARALLATGQPELAKQDLQKVVETQPETLDAYLELAKINAGEGNLDKAIELAEKARSSRALTEEATVLVATWRAQSGRLEQAIQDLQGLLQTHSFRIETHFQLADYLLRVQDYREAERRFRAGLEMEPTNGGALLGLGQALEGQGKIEEARQLYTTLSQSGPAENPVVKAAQERLSQLKGSLGPGKAP